VGEEVARAAVIKLMKKLSAYAGGDYGLKDSGFLLRAAFALTNFGEKNNQYIHQIWELDEYQFNQTLNSPLAAFLTSDIDWFTYETLVFDQLNVPYFSLVAFVTYTVEIVKIQISNDLTIQGEIFKQISHNKITEWVEKIADLEIIQEETCGAQLNDIVFLVDESGSVGAPNFQLMKSFLAQFASVVDPDRTRIAVRTFSTKTRLYFGLKEPKNKVQLINELPYLTGWTNTSLALLGALRDFEDDRNSVKIVITITDGISQDPAATKRAADKLKADPRNIQSFAIGVAGAQMFELENIASSNDHVEMLENFDAFTKILSTVLDKVCTTGIEIHQSGKIEIAGKTEKTESKVLVLSMNGKKSFEVSSEKNARAYVSFDNSNPSEAAYDFRFEIEAGAKKEFSVDKYYEKIYIALYNIEAEATLIGILINDKDFDVIPEITKCLFGSKCVDSQCFCDEGYIISRRPEGCMFDPTLTPCERYGSRCGDNSVCSVQKYAPYYECSCAEGFIGAAPKCVKKCDDGEREIKEFLAFVDYLCKNQFFIDYEPVENNIMTNLKINQNSQVDVNISLDSMLKHMIAAEMPEDGKAKLEFMLGKNVEDFMLHFFENGDLEDLFRDF